MVEGYDIYRTQIDVLKLLHLVLTMTSRNQEHKEQHLAEMKRLQVACDFKAVDQIQPLPSLLNPPIIPLILKLIPPYSQNQTSQYRVGPQSAHSAVKVPIAARQARSAIGSISYQSVIHPPVKAAIDIPIAPPPAAVAQAATHAAAAEMQATTLQPRAIRLSSSHWATSVLLPEGQILSCSKFASSQSTCRASMVGQLSVSCRRFMKVAAES